MIKQIYQERLRAMVRAPRHWEIAKVLKIAIVVLLVITPIVGISLAAAIEKSGDAAIADRTCLYKCELTFSLQETAFVVGQADRLVLFDKRNRQQESYDYCVAFLINKPGEYSIEIEDGAYFKYEPGQDYPSIYFYHDFWRLPKWIPSARAYQRALFEDQTYIRSTYCPSYFDEPCELKSVIWA